ncbi:MAG: alpha/beta hydrolase, partial [Clostridia bacterium]|nr:alpha/beta hydrolase [Clostridia bacterium]
MMPEWVVDLLIDFAAVFGVILGLYCLSRFYYKRSVMATLAEWYLRCTEKKYPDEKVIEDLPKLPLRNDVPLFAPKRLQKKMPIEKALVGEMQVFVFNGGDRSLATLYLHGAGYVRPPRKQHWKFAFRLAKKTGGKVFFAVYPKAPNHTCDEAYELLLAAYKRIRAEHETVVLAGDSSGGGLALGFYQKLVKEGQEKPNDLWLLSPWVDLSMENPQIEKYAKTDPLVCVS